MDVDRPVGSAELSDRVGVDGLRDSEARPRPDGSGSDPPPQPANRSKHHNDAPTRAPMPRLCPTVRSEHVEQLPHGPFGCRSSSVASGPARAARRRRSSDAAWPLNCANARFQASRAALGPHAADFGCPRRHRVGRSRTVSRCVFALFMTPPGCSSKRRPRDVRARERLRDTDCLRAPDDERAPVAKDLCPTSAGSPDESAARRCITRCWRRRRR